MQDAMFRMLFFVLMNFFIFGGIYFFGKRYHPKLAPWLAGGSFIVLTSLCYFSVTWIMVSITLSLVYLRILRKPDQTAAFQALYAVHNIYTTTKFSQAALNILGDKKWRYAEGKIQGHGTTAIPFFFWQGHTSSMVSSGQYVRTTVYTHYLAFVFAPGSITDTFKRRAIAAADKSHYPFTKKLKFFFTPDTETPNLVTTAADGSFIIQYVIISDVAHYSRRLEWIKQNIDNRQQPVIGFTLSAN